MSRPRTSYDDRGSEPPPRWEPLEQRAARRGAAIGCATTAAILLIAFLFFMIALFSSCNVRY